MAISHHLFTIQSLIHFPEVSIVRRLGQITRIMTANRPPNFEFLEDYAKFCPDEAADFYQAVASVTKAIVFAGQHQIQRLLVDTTQLTGFPPPSVTQRFVMAEQWANASRGLRLALIARAELIDPEYFGVTVARNRGLLNHVFTSEADALDWLMHPELD